MGKSRHPCPVGRHTSIEAAGYWGPRCSALALWLRLEAKSKRALGPGATVGVLGTGVPRLACLQPRAWLHQRLVWPIFISNHSRPSQGAKSREGTMQDLLRGGLARLAPEERRYLCKGHLARFA